MNPDTFSSIIHMIPLSYHMNSYHYSIILGSSTSIYYSTTSISYSIEKLPAYKRPPAAKILSEIAHD